MAVSLEVLDLATLTRTGPLIWTKIDITPTHNQSGPAVVELPATDANWDLIAFDVNGDLVPFGLHVNWNGVYQVPVLVEDWAYSSTVDTGGALKQSLTLTGADMTAVLAGRIAYPNPGAAWSGQTITTTTYTGHAETVIKNILTANLVTASDTARRAPLTIAADAGRGGTVTYKVVDPNPAATTGTQTTTVQQNLMDMVRAVAAQTPIGVRVTLGAGQLVVDCYIPRDLTSVAVFSTGLGNLTDTKLTAAAPTGNAILLQSKVTGANFTEVHGHLGTNPWRRIEQFSDQSSTDTAADITTAGAAAVASGASKVSLQVTVADIPQLRFGADDLANGVQGYLVGDTVTVEIRAGIEFAEIIGQVQLVADATPGQAYKETATPSIGDPSAADQTITATLAAQLRTLQLRTT